MMDSQVVTANKLKSTVTGLNELVRLNSATDEGETSTIRGLVCVATAFAVLLDAYAKPNAENSQGMCDDPIAFRQYFADVLLGTPLAPEGEPE